MHDQRVGWLDTVRADGKSMEAAATLICGKAMEAAAALT